MREIMIEIERKNNSERSDKVQSNHEIIPFSWVVCIKSDCDDQITKMYSITKLERLAIDAYFVYDHDKCQDDTNNIEIA